MNCPRNYSDNPPRACCLACPIRNGEQVDERYYTVNGAANLDTSPVKGVSVGKINLERWRGTILTVSTTDDPNAQGQGVRKMPECALIAWQRAIEIRKQELADKKQSKAEQKAKQEAERKARIASGLGQKRTRKGVNVIKPVSVLDTQFVDTIDAAQERETHKPLSKSDRAAQLIMREIAKVQGAKARGVTYRPLSYAAIARTIEVTRELVRATAKRRGIEIW